MFNIGCNIDESWVDARMARLHEALQSFRDLGLDAVELPIHGLDLIMNGKLNQRRLTEVLGMLKDFDFHYSIHCPNPVNLMDRKNVGLHVDVILASMEFARQSGAGILVYHAGRFFPEETFFSVTAHALTRKENDSLLEREALLLQIVSEQYPDVTLAVENARPYQNQSPHYTYGETLDRLKTQIEAVNKPNVGINLDFGHLYMSSVFHGFDPSEAVKDVRSLVVHTHIHDNFGGIVHHWEKQQTFQLPFGKGDSHMPVGWGKVPVRSILGALLPEYQGLFMMELRARYADHVADSTRTLKTLLASQSL